MLLKPIRRTRRFNQSILDGHVDPGSGCNVRTFITSMYDTQLRVSLTPCRDNAGTTKMSVIRKMLSTELVGAGLLGLWILENDQWLWASARSHAYGLVGFVIVDLALAFAAARGISWDSMGVSVAALIQVVAMLGDLENGQPIGRRYPSRRTLRRIPLLRAASAPLALSGDRSALVAGTR